MNEDELDAAIAERFKAYEAGIRLPGEFKGRLVGSIRRKRTLRRIWMFGLICVTAIASVAIANLARPNAMRGGARPALTAHTVPANEVEAVSYWMLLGYLREFFSRFRTARRKEEESDTPEGK